MEVGEKGYRYAFGASAAALRSMQPRAARNNSSLSLLAS
jgi:hypothetical protein